MKKRSFLVLFLYLVVSSALASDKNPLIRQELFPFSNAGFEEGLKDWGGNAEDDYRVARASDGKTVFESSATASEGKRSLVVFLDEFRNPGDAHIERGFPLGKGSRYYVSMQVKSEGDTRAVLRITGDVSGGNVVRDVPEKRRDKPSSDWQEVGITFETTTKAAVASTSALASDVAKCNLKIEPFGLGKLIIDEVRVHELIDYSPHLRIKLLHPAAGKFRLHILARVSRPKEHFNRKYFQEAGVQAGEFSPWIDLNEDGDFKGTPFRSNPDVISAGLQFASLDGKPFEQVTAQIDFAYGPEESRIIKTVKESTEGNIIGLLFARSEANPEDFLSSFRLIRDDARARNEQIKSLKLPPVSLKHFMIETGITGFGNYYTDPKIVELEINTLKHIGFSGLQYNGLSGLHRRIAAREGIFKTHHTYRDYLFHPAPRIRKRAVIDEMAASDPFWRDWFSRGNGVHATSWPDVKRMLSDSVGSWFTRVKNKDPDQIPLIAFIDIGDEISGTAFGGKEYNAQFQEYLQQQGLKPEDFGKNTWGHVTPVGLGGGSPNEVVAFNKPLDRTDLPACRRFYWSLKFWTFSNAKWRNIVTRELGRRLPGIPTRVNFGMPWWYFCATDLHADDIWEFAREKAVTAMSNEDWTSTYEATRYS
jgi:hypothetical protein